MSKKGSLNLSINAIVVLILAITMLGLGLGFMKTMFGKATEQFEDVAGEMKTRIIEDIKSSNKRISLNAQDIEMKRGSSKEYFYGVRNDLEAAMTFQVNPDTKGFIKASGKWETTAASVPTGYAVDSTIICYTNNEGGELSTTVTSIKPHINFKTNKGLYVKENDVSVAKLFISVSSGAELTSYSCSMLICEPNANGACAGDEYARKDFTITVK